MKQTISKIIQFIFIIIGIIPFLINLVWKNKYCEWVITKINNVMFAVNWWGKK